MRKLPSSLGPRMRAITLAALGAAVVLFASQVLLADNSPATSASASKAAAAASSGVAAAQGATVDLERSPPTELGTELDAKDDWSNEPKVKLRRARLSSSASRWKQTVTTENCDVRMRKDWLRIRCEGAVGRVNQLSGDPRNTLVHIYNGFESTANGGRVDRRRLLMYVRMVPEHVSTFEITTIGTGYDSDWEGEPSLLTVDWSDPDAGPRVLITPLIPAYAL